MSFFVKFQGWIVGCLLFLASAAGVIHIQSNYRHQPVKQGVKFAFNEGFPSFSPDTIRLLSLGYPYALSSLLWIRFLIQMPPEHLRGAEVSWIYLDLKAISEIDPDFVPVYTHGAMYLSVITEDKAGAKLLLEKGVAKYPQFWRFRAYLAYHYQFELLDPLAAAHEYAEAAKLPGAPKYFAALAGRLYEQAGNKEVAIQVLESMLDGAQDPSIRSRIEEKLKKLKAEE